jgi:Spy/CpxP family protein refolding chaperone
MKKFASTLAALALAAGLSTTALAAQDMGPGYGPGHGPGQGPGWTQLTPEQRAEATKVRADFLNETLALRQKLATKKVELSTLRHQPTPDQAKIKAAADEMVDLGAQLAKKRNEYMAKYPNAFGPGMGRGMGGGMCGGGMGGGKGMGGGMMGGGMGMGPGGSY